MKCINIGVLAHVDAGKTTLCERLLALAHAIREPGSVDKGSAVTDWLPIERERGISVAAASASLTWRDAAINIIDTPGHADLAADTERALLAVDAVVLVVSAADGVEAQTRKYWQSIRALDIPCAIFINKCDRLGVVADDVRADISMNLTKNTVYFNDPHDEGAGTFSTTDKGVASLTDDELLTILEDDEDAAMAFLDGARPSDDEIARALRERVASAKVYPAIWGAASNGTGAERLLDAIADLLPQADRDDGAPLSGVIFKVEHDERMGKASIARIFSGEMKNRDAIELTRPSEPVGSDERTHSGKITQIRRVMGASRIDSGAARAGDVAAIYGLEAARAGDVIGDFARISERISRNARLAIPLMSSCVSAAPEHISDLLAEVSRLRDEDPLLDLEWDPSTREITIKIMGKIHLEIIERVLADRCPFEVSFSRPSVIYRETPERAGEGYEEYTMPKPCWAIVRLAISPLPRGAGLEFSSSVPNDQMLYRYQNHVEISVARTLKQGLYGWQVTDLRVELIGGEHHPVHTHNMDFFLATPIAVMDGLRNCGTKLLEPTLDIVMTADESLAGKLMGDVLAMRGTAHGSTIKGGSVTIEAEIPASEASEYPAAFASITSGKGVMSSEFCGWRECPKELAAVRPRIGVDPLDRAKWILANRGAVSM